MPSRKLSRWFRRGACLAALTLAAGAPASARDWWLGRSASFEVWSGASERETREIVERLELFRAFVLLRTGVEPAAPAVPTTLVIFGRAREFAPLRPRRDVAGFFQGAAHRNFLVVDASRRDEAIRIAQHEFAHYVLATGTRASAPPWYHEGFAELLSTIRRDGDMIVMGEPPLDRLRHVVAGNSLPLARVLGGNEILRWSSSALRAFYAQSWLLTHYLHWGSIAGFPQRAEQMVEYLKLVDGGVEVEAAVSQAFGIGIDELERELLAYLDQGKLPMLKFALTALPAWSGEATLTQLSPLERDARLAGLALDGGSASREVALRWASDVLKASPAHPLALSLRACLAAQRADADAGVWIARARVHAGESPEAQWRVADALAAHGALDPAALDEAAREYEKSLRSPATQGVALIGSARLARARGDFARAIERFELARALLPAYEPLDFELAQLYAAAKRPDEARKSLRRVLARSHEGSAAALDLAAFAKLLEETGFPDEGALATRHLVARLDLDVPAASAEVARIPLAEVRGRAGLWEAAFHDVVLVLDESGSTFEACGSDLDGDGAVGRTIASRGESSDPDDSIFRAELIAARRLSQQFGAAAVRVGLIGFWHEARVHVPLGEPAALIAQLDAGAIRQPPDGGGTSLALGLARALELLVDSRDPKLRRQRTILLLSDGVPTVPSPALGAKQALEVAERLAEYGIRVHTFALGKEALKGTDAFREIAQRTGGKFVPVARPADVVSFLREISLTGLEDVRVRNLTTGKQGRATRVFPDGSFDGFVELAPGENRIEVTAHVDGRGPLREIRRLDYEPAPRGDPFAAAEQQRLLEVLRLRNVETELARRKRSSLAIDADDTQASEQRSLELRVREGGGEAAGPEAGADEN